jgi:translocator protein
MIMTIVVAAAAALAVAVIGGLLTEVGPWYHALRKPRWQPPDWLFGPAWSVILALAAWSGALAWQGAHDDAERVRVIVLFAINGAAHVLWSPLFFKLRRPDWALAEVPLLWLSIVALMIGLGAQAPTLPWLLAPYLLWVTFAAWLNLAIVRLNAPFGAAR